MTIAENIDKLRHEIPSSVKIVAVSKTRSADEIMEAYRTGQRIFGENKAQELVSKHATLPSDIEWHFIGHLQTNKVRQVVASAGMIESIDSLKLLRIVNSEAGLANRPVNCLLQFHIAREETKFGLDPAEAASLMEAIRNEKMENIHIQGVMGMATFTNDEQQIGSEFSYLKSCYDRLKSEFFSGDDHFREISMGMSGDYLLAVKQGSTMIRVGTVIFGERVY